MPQPWTTPLTQTKIFQLWFDGYVQLKKIVSMKELYHALHKNVTWKKIIVWHIIKCFLEICIYNGNLLPWLYTDCPIIITLQQISTGTCRFVSNKTMLGKT